jgi:hypothetical protein
VKPFQNHTEGQQGRPAVSTNSYVTYQKAAVEAEIATICPSRWVADIITVTLTGDKPADIVAAYRSQSDAEFGFRQLTDPHLVSFSPMHHWIRRQDPRPRVLLRARPCHRPPDAPPRRPKRACTCPRELLELAGIEETVLLDHDGGKGRPRVPTHAHRHDPHPTAPGPLPLEQSE